MLETTLEELQEILPDVTTIEAIDFCLKHLHLEKEKSLGETVASICIYEEIIGALNSAKSDLENFQSYERFNEELEDASEEFIKRIEEIKKEHSPE